MLSPWNTADHSNHQNQGKDDEHENEQAKHWHGILSILLAVHGDSQ
jgi:hypothetical protein